MTPQLFIAYSDLLTRIPVGYKILAETAGATYSTFVAYAATNPIQTLLAQRNQNTEQARDALNANLTLIQSYQAALTETILQINEALQAIQQLSTIISLQPMKDNSDLAALENLQQLFLVGEKFTQQITAQGNQIGELFFHFAQLGQQIESELPARRRARAFISQNLQNNYGLDGLLLETREGNELLDRICFQLPRGIDESPNWTTYPGVAQLQEIIWNFVANNFPNNLPCEPVAMEIDKRPQRSVVHDENVAPTNGQTKNKKTVILEQSKRANKSREETSAIERAREIKYTSYTSKQREASVSHNPSRPMLRDITSGTSQHQSKRVPMDIDSKPSRSTPRPRPY